MTLTTLPHTPVPTPSEHTAINMKYKKISYEDEENNEKESLYDYVKRNFAVLLGFKVVFVNSTSYIILMFSVVT